MANSGDAAAEGVEDDGFAQTAAGAVAGHRIADLAAGRIADTKSLGGVLGGHTCGGLENQSGCDPFAPRGGNMEEFGALLEPLDRCGHSFTRPPD